MNFVCFFFSFRIRFLTDLDQMRLKIREGLDCINKSRVYVERGENDDFFSVS